MHHADWLTEADSGYEIEMELDASLVSGTDSWRLDLGDVREVACVLVNGQEVDCVWNLPFACRLDGHLQPGLNRLSIEVTNLGANRIRDLDRRGCSGRCGLCHCSGPQAIHSEITWPPTSVSRKSRPWKR